MKSFLLFLSLAVLTAGAFAQNDFGLAAQQAPDRVPVSGPVAAQQQKGILDAFWGSTPDLKPLPKKKWTVMVFMNGKNDLKDAMLLNLNMMESAGSSDNVNIVAELGKIGGMLSWGGSRRMYVTKDNDFEKITSNALMKTKKVDLGDYKRAVDFVKWSKQHFPAEKYMLIISNHGSGFMDPRQGGNGNKGISFDDETGNYIRTKQIGQLVREAGGVDLLAYDACLMQMGEVLAEVGPAAKVIVGSEETIPGVGFPYHTILAKLDPKTDAAGFGSLIVREFAAFYAPKGKAVQLSAIRTDKLPGFYEVSRNFAAAVARSTDDKALKAARDGVLRFDVIPKDPAKQVSFYGDMYDFADLLKKNLSKPDPALAAAAEALQNYIVRELVTENSYANKDAAGNSYERARGVAAYMAPVMSSKIPQAKLEGIMEESYQNYEFAKLTGWYGLATRLYGLP